MATTADSQGFSTDTFEEQYPREGEPDENESSAEKPLKGL